MLEKNKDYIEFLMHTMMVTYKPYQVAGIEITGSNPDGRDLLFGNNPFDIPCDVVVIPKKDFEKLQASVASHEKQDEEYLNFLKALFPGEDVEKLAWMTRQVCEPVVSHGAAKYWKDKCEQLQADLEFHKEMAKTHESNYKLLLEKTGFTSLAALTAYICDSCSNPPEGCKTLKKTIEEREKEVKTLDARIDKWKKATKCNSPEEAEKQIELLVDDINVLMRMI